MSNESLPEVLYCKDTRVVQTHLILPPDLNYHQTLFGGKLMGFIDNCAAISAARLSRKPVVTASTDRLDFFEPLYANQSVCLESFVSGTGRTSMEVFVKVTGEDLPTGRRFIAATCFMTFVAAGDLPEGYTLPRVQPETAEEIAVSKDYLTRKENRMRDLKLREAFAKEISLDPPWM